MRREVSDALVVFKREGRDDGEVVVAEEADGHAPPAEAPRQTAADMAASGDASSIDEAWPRVLGVSVIADAANVAAMPVSGRLELVPALDHVLVLVHHRVPAGNVGEALDERAAVAHGIPAWQCRRHRGP